ncbi:MAG: glycosyltransferase family 4 protein [Acidobacteriota bacterium]|nr:glycosyltransferase family 4 protein [Acidobacteriota bacterium]
MNGQINPSKKVVVVHRGARDAYQVSAALAEAGLLDALVTDLYWPKDRAWARGIEKLLPVSVRGLLGARNHPNLPSALVDQTLVSGITSFLLDKSGRAPFSWRRRATRWTDAALGIAAGRRGTANKSLLLSYSYYGHHAFSNYDRPGMLFQLHPHPESVRQILTRELADHPDCSSSLEKEWELSLGREDFAKLVAETKMASHFLAASSFTRRTLIENGTAADAITVLPYGVDSKRFTPGPDALKKRTSGPLRLLFVGTINQRKGIKYLLEALRLLRYKEVHLTVCGRVVDDLQLFKPFVSQVDIRPSVGFAELLQAYQESDLFVFPSVAEGFAQVLLESLACGLPILSTTHTAAPDLIDEGIQGFVVEPRRPDQIAERIEWALCHRSQLCEMRGAARARAQEFTWERFRAGVVDSVRAFQSIPRTESEEAAQYV